MSKPTSRPTRSTVPAIVAVLLDEVPLSRGLDDRERGVLGTALVARVLEPGEVLCREGERGASFFAVARGAIDVLKELPGGRRERLAELGPGALIGQVSLIDGKPRSATCIARLRSAVLECDRESFERLYRAGNSFAFKVIDSLVVDLARRLRQADAQLKAIYDRPAETLLALHEAALGVQSTVETGEMRAVLTRPR